MRACVRAGVHGSRIILCKSREHPRYLDDCRCGRASLKLAERFFFFNNNNNSKRKLLRLLKKL